MCAGSIIPIVGVLNELYGGKVSPLPPGLHMRLPCAVMLPPEAHDVAALFVGQVTEPIVDDITTHEPFQSDVTVPPDE